MSESKVPRGEYVKMRAADRIRTWKWWYVLLLLIAIVAAILSLVGILSPQTPKVGATHSSPVWAVAFMQTGGSAPPVDAHPKRSDAEMRPFIMVGILSLIAIVLLVSLGVSLFSKNAGAVSTASDLVKTCIGFFIGIATGYFGQ